MVCWLHPAAHKGIGLAPQLLQEALRLVLLHEYTARSLSDYALIPHIFVVCRKLMLAILAIWLCLIFDKRLDL
jgi:hypothetical protein